MRRLSQVIKVSRLMRNARYPRCSVLVLITFFVCQHPVTAQSNRTATVMDPSSVNWSASPANFAGMSSSTGTIGLDSTRWTGVETNPHRWAFSVADQEFENATVSARLTIQSAAKSFRFFGESWSVWPDQTFSDQGFEAAILLKAAESPSFPTRCGYRIQFSIKYQCVALVKYPQGGYLRVVPCPLDINKPIEVSVTTQANEISVQVNDRERIRYRDTIQPLKKGKIGFGVSSGARIQCDAIQISQIRATSPSVTPESSPHQPQFSVRKFLGDRQWVFDGDEPILLLPVPDASYINNVKLIPGFKPQLSWNSHWDIQNQGAFPEGTNKIESPEIVQQGQTLIARWNARQTKDRFTTQTEMTVGWNRDRQVYQYDIDSHLKVLPGDPFHFRYGFDFEHHTPLDPFNWQYLVIKRENDEYVQRPVYPIDPGPTTDVESYHGLRMWYGRHNEELLIAPAVEYEVDPRSNTRVDEKGLAVPRKLNTAVCAAFYDTGVSFAPETAKPGTTVRVKYRYTGYPQTEAKRIFDRSQTYQSHMLDPNHYYIFADEWPTLTFRQHVPMNQTWQYGRTPFMSGHNARPSYQLAKVDDLPVSVASTRQGFAMQLGPVSNATATLPTPEPLQKGNYQVSAWVKSDNVQGQGGRLELNIKEPKTGKSLATWKHYTGHGSFPWQQTGFTFEIPQDGCSLELTLANAGTGDVFVTNVSFQKSDTSAPRPPGILDSPNSQPPRVTASPDGAIADYRMVEGKGMHVLDFAGGPFGPLELANLHWKDTGEFHAIEFSNSTIDQPRYPRAGALDRGYFGHPAYADKRLTPVAIAGTHGGGMEWNAFTTVVWIKPAAEMGQSTHGGKGDIIGLGARRFILSLYNQKAPYQLGARVNVNDSFLADGTRLEADRWYQVGMSGEPTADKKWRVKLYVDGKLVHSGVTVKQESPMSIPPSIILGSEIFYLHDAYYRGMIGRVLVFNKVLMPDELTALNP